MIDKVISVLTNPTFVNYAQNTKATVTTESIFKAVGRPVFILKDDSIDDKTKKYAATKEGLYQLLCLGIYLGMVGPVFKKPMFKMAQKILKNQKDLPNFSKVEEYETYLKLRALPIEQRSKSKLMDSLPDTIYENKTSKVTLKENLLLFEKPDKYKTEKGIVELSYLTGTVFGLALFASELSNLILHPIMKVLGFEKTSEKSKGFDKKV